jgi:hypothetical protein
MTKSGRHGDSREATRDVGAAVLLAGIARQRDRVPNPAALRELLRRTGTPQTGKVDPRPDLARAIPELR